MTDYNWTVTRMDSVASVDGLSGMVVTVFWTCSGSEVLDGFTYTSAVSDSTPIPYTPEDPWVEYVDIDQNIALEWCWEHGVSKSLIEGVVQGYIDSSPKPPAANTPLPW